MCCAESDCEVVMVAIVMFVIVVFGSGRATKVIEDL